MTSTVTRAGIMVNSLIIVIKRQRMTMIACLYIILRRRRKNAIYRKDIARHLVIKKELNLEYVNLGTDMVPMTRQRLAADASTSAKQ